MDPKAEIQELETDEACNDRKPSRRQRSKLFSENVDLVTPTKSKKEDEDSDGDLVDVKDEDALPGPPDGDDEVEEDYSCLGCDKTKLTGRNHSDPSKNLEWVGRWCKPCWTCWRTVFRTRFTLVVFGKSLKKDSDLKIEWAETLLAFHVASQMCVGRTRVTFPKVQECLEMIRNLKLLTGWSFSPRVCVPVAALTDMHNDTLDRLPFVVPETFDPNTICHTFDGTGLRLGVMLPLRTNLACQSCPRPVANETAGLLGAHRFLHCSSEPDTNWIQGLWDVNIQRDTTAMGSDDNAPALKLRNQTLNSIREFHSQLIVFGTADWVDRKESEMTTAINKLGNMKAEVQCEGDGACDDLLEKAMMGAQVGKQFIKKYRDYIKSRRRLAKFKDLASKAVRFHEYLVSDANVEPYHTLSMQMLKGRFWEAFGDEAALKEATSAMHRAGLFDILSKFQASAAPPTEESVVKVEEGIEDLSLNSNSSRSPSVWLRGFLFEAVEQMFAKHEAADVSTYPKAIDCICASLTDCLDVLRSDCDPQNPGKDHMFAEVSIDLTKLRTYMSGASAQNKASVIAVKEAQEFIKVTTHMSPIAQILKQKNLGKHVVSVASSSMQRSAQDGIGDTKMQRARAIMDEDTFPVAEVLAGDLADGSSKISTVAFRFCDSLTDGVIESADESLCLLAEASKLWSQLALEGSRDEIKAWLGKMINSLHILDDGASCLLVSLYDRLSIFDYSGPNESMEAFSEEASEALVALCDGQPQPKTSNLKVLRDALESELVDDDGLSRFVNQLVRLVRVLEQRFSDEDGLLRERLEALEKKVSINTGIRTSIVDCLTSIASISDFELSPAGAVEEWLSSKNASKRKSTLLSVAMDIQRQFKDMEDKELVFTEDVWPVPCDFVHLIYAHNKTIACDVFTAKHLSSVIFNSPLVTYTTQVAKEGLGMSLEAYSESIPFHGVRSPAPGENVLAHPDVSTALATFFCKHTLVEMAGVAAKAFFNPNFAHGEWKVDSCLDLVQSLINPLSDETFQVSVECLLRDHDLHTEGELESAIVPSCIITSKDALIKAMELMKHVGKLSCTVAFIAQRLVGSLIFNKDSTIRKDIERALQFVRLETMNLHSYLQRGEFSLVSGPEALAQVTSMEWKLQLDESVNFVTSLRSLVSRVLHQVLKAMVTKSTVIAAEVVGLTPKYAHIITDASINNSLARRHLVNICPATKEQLGIKVEALNNLLEDISRFHAAFSMAPALTDDVDIKDDLGSSAKAYKDGFEAICVIAGVSVLLKMEGQTQKTQAEKLQDSFDSMPKSLSSKLQKLVPLAKKPKASEKK